MWAIVKINDIDGHLEYCVSFNTKEEAEHYCYYLTNLEEELLCTNEITLDEMGKYTTMYLPNK